MTFKVGDKVLVDLSEPVSNWHKCEGIVVVPEYRGRHHSRVRLTALGPKAVGLFVGHEYTLGNLTHVHEGPLSETLVPAAVDVVNDAPHYGGKDNPYEVIKVAEAWGLDKDAYLFNVLKYIGRADKKGASLQDHKKARYYLDRKIQRLEEAAK